MKKFLIILSLLTSTVYAQTDNDIKLFNDLNTYRVSNGVKALEFDTLLYKRGSAEQLSNMVEADSIYHSDVSEETVMYLNSLPLIEEEKGDEFDKFLKKYYNMSYEDFNPSSEDLQRDKLMGYITKYVIFIFQTSKHHRASMLSNYNYFGGAAISVEDIVFKKGTKEKIDSMPVALRGHFKYTDNIKSIYKFKLFSCMNFNDYKFK